MTCPVGDRLTINVKSYQPQDSNGFHYRLVVYVLYTKKFKLPNSQELLENTDRELRVTGEVEAY